MGFEDIICLVIYIFVAFFMIGIGVSQLKSKTPAAFYSGEKPFEENELSDVAMWNKKHGMMWIVYGAIIILSGIAGAVIGMESLWSIIPMCG